jgi:hypothetical protein
MSHSKHCCDFNAKSKTKPNIAEMLKSAFVRLVRVAPARRYTTYARSLASFRSCLRIISRCSLRKSIAPPKAGVDWESMSFALTRTDWMYVAETAKDSPFNKGLAKPYGKKESSSARCGYA